MTGYAKMRAFGGKSKSRSVDFSELLQSPSAEEPRPMSNTCPNLESTTPKSSLTHSRTHIKSDNNSTTPSAAAKGARAENSYSCTGQENDEPNGERFGVILGRSSSVSSEAASNRFIKQRGGAVVQYSATVKRVLSMRRSSSVCERYCRIHDQSATLAPHVDSDGNDNDEDEHSVEGVGTPGSSLKKQSKKPREFKIFKACKRLLGL